MEETVEKMDRWWTPSVWGLMASERRSFGLVEELVEKMGRWWTPSVSALARLEDSEGSGSMGSRVWCPCAAGAELWLGATRVLASWHLLMGQI